MASAPHLLSLKLPFATRTNEMRSTEETVIPSDLNLWGPEEPLTVVLFPKPEEQGQYWLSLSMLGKDKGTEPRAALEP